MAGEMFGAPIGISAAETQINQNALAGLKAQQTLGEIGMQPAEMALKQAHARFYGAEAAKYENQATAMARLQAISQSVSMQRAAAQAALGGQVLTAADYQASLTDPTEQVIAEARRQGMSEVDLLPLVKEVSLSKQQEAAAASHRAEITSKQIKQQKEIAKSISSFAQSALDGGPEQYPQVLMAAAHAGLPVDKVPKYFDANILARVRDFGIDAEKKLEFKERMAQNAAHRALWESNKEKNKAYIATSAARRELIGVEVDVKRKNDGEGSPSTVERRAEMNAASRDKRAAAKLKEAPPLPASPSVLDGDPRPAHLKYYTLPDKSRALAIRDPKTGKWGFQRIAPPPAAPRSAPAPVFSTAEEPADIEEE